MSEKLKRNYYLSGTQRVRSANEKLIKLGISEGVEGRRQGVILIDFNNGPLSIRKTITRDQIRKAYKKAVENDAEEL